MVSNGMYGLSRAVYGDAMNQVKILFMCGRHRNGLVWDDNWISSLEATFSRDGEGFIVDWELFSCPNKKKKSCSHTWRVVTSVTKGGN